MFRSINCRKVLSGMFFSLLLGLSGFAHAQSKPAQPKPGQAKPAQSKPQATPFVPNAKAGDQVVISQMSTEINALQTLRQFQFDNDQLAKMAKLAIGPLGKPGTTSMYNQSRVTGKPSKEVRDKMSAIQKALLEGRAEAEVTKMTEELAAVLEKEKVSIDDNIKITDGARKEAVTVYRMLRADQLAGYIGQIAESIDDPIDQFMDSLEEIGKLNDDEWKEQQAEIADEIAQTVAGLDSAKAKKVSADLLPLLGKARGLSKADLEKKRSELEQAAQTILGDTSAESILRNRVQVDLATLLSNGRVVLACHEIIKANNQANTAPKK